MIKAISRNANLLSKITTVKYLPSKMAASTIPSDKDQQGGRRREEIDAEEAGEVGFNSDPIVPEVNAGTKANPILVPSGRASRVVGFESPGSNQVLWFNLNKGPLHFVPDLGLYFKLKPI